MCVHNLSRDLSVIFGRVSCMLVESGCIDSEYFTVVNEVNQ